MFSFFRIPTDMYDVFDEDEELPQEYAEPSLGNLGVSGPTGEDSHLEADYEDRNGGDFDGG